MVAALGRAEETLHRKAEGGVVTLLARLFLRRPQLLARVLARTRALLAVPAVPVLVLVPVLIRKTRSGTTGSTKVWKG